MPFPVSAMPFPMPPLVNIAVKILFQSKRLENCLTFELAKYNLVIFWLYNTIVFCKLQNVNIILLGAFPNATGAFSDTSIVYYSSKRYVPSNTFEKLLNILFSEVYCWSSGCHQCLFRYLYCLLQQ